MIFERRCSCHCRPPPRGTVPLLTGPGDARAIAVALPMVLAALGLVVSIFGIFAARMMRNNAPALVLRAAMVLPFPLPRLVPWGGYPFSDY